jgi:hypothetical protein
MWCSKFTLKKLAALLEKRPRLTCMFAELPKRVGEFELGLYLGP